MRSSSLIIWKRFFFFASCRVTADLLELSLRGSMTKPPFEMVCETEDCRLPARRPSAGRARSGLTRRESMVAVVNGLAATTVVRSIATPTRCDPLLQFDDLEAGLLLRILARFD